MLGSERRGSLPLITVTKNRFSVSSFIAPEMDPIAQQSVFKFAHDHSDPSTCFESFSVTVSEEASQQNSSDESEKQFSITY